jgi:hypothetical protein
MGKMKPRLDTDTVLFDVFYEDGSRASNRKVPAALLGGLDGDAPALTHIMGEEQRFAELAGRSPKSIKRLVRSG